MNLLIFFNKVFVQLVGSTGEDIFFVAMPSNGEYTFELDVASASKESFASKSGAYKMVCNLYNIVSHVISTIPCTSLL